MSTVTKLPDWEARCIRVAAKKHTKLSSAVSWLYWQHGIDIKKMHILTSINPCLR